MFYLKNNTESFDYLVELFTLLGMNVKVENEEFNWCFIDNHDIVIGFSVDHKMYCYASEWVINGRIAFENKKFFNKFKQVPYSLPLPKTQSQIDFLIQCINKERNTDIEAEFKIYEYPES